MPSFNFCVGRFCSVWSLTPVCFGILESLWPYFCMVQLSSGLPLSVECICKVPYTKYLTTLGPVFTLFALCPAVGPGEIWSGCAGEMRSSGKHLFPSQTQ